MTRDLTTISDIHSLRSLCSKVQHLQTCLDNNNGKLPWVEDQLNEERVGRERDRQDFEVIRCSLEAQLTGLNARVRTMLRDKAILRSDLDEARRTLQRMRQPGEIDEEGRTDGWSEATVVASTCITIPSSLKLHNAITNNLLLVVSLIAAISRSSKRVKARRHVHELKKLLAPSMSTPLLRETMKLVNDCLVVGGIADPAENFCGNIRVQGGRTASLSSRLG